MRAAEEADGRGQGLYITDTYVNASLRRGSCRRGTSPAVI